MLLIVTLFFSVKASIFSETSTIKISNSYIERTSTNEYKRLSSNLSDLKQAFVGQNCGATNQFYTEGVYANPYPFSAGASVEFTQYGYFYQNMFIQENIFGICYNNKAWTYIPFNISQNVQAGNMYHFITTVQIPTDPGSYIMNMQLYSGNYISCWDFLFNI